MKKNNFYFASSFSDVTMYLKTIPNIKIFSGGTSKSWRDEETNKFIFPNSTLCISHVPEFKTIERNERYIDLGSCITLSEIENIGEKRLPLTLYNAIESISNPFVKNLATIGGNICNENSTLLASLIALDAKLELHSVNESKQIYVKKISSIPNGFILTKIKIPYGNWDKSFFIRIGPERKITKDSYSFVFLANTEKGILNNVSIVFAGENIIQLNDFENDLIGSKLPLSKKIVDEKIENAKHSLYELIKEKNIIFSDILKKQYINLLKYSMLHL